jgi:hypothetical protein
MYPTRVQAVVGDFGCGDGRLGETIPCTTHSFDLVTHRPHITACNIAHVPLTDGVLDVAVFCLSLMGTDFLQFIQVLSNPVVTIAAAIATPDAADCLRCSFGGDISAGCCLSSVVNVLALTSLLRNRRRRSDA